MTNVPECLTFVNWEPEGTRRNAEKRAPGWAKFLKQLKKEGKLK